MAEIQGTITRRLESIFTDLKVEFGTVCTKYDIDVKLRELNASRGKSDYFSNLSAFMDMLDSLNIDYDDSRTDYDYFESLTKGIKLPDYEDLEGNMIHKLYQIFEDYPKPDEYMRRIVNRLSNPEDKWENDTLRLRILKQFVKYGNFLYDAGVGGRMYIKKYVKAKNNGTDIIENLDDEIFEVLKGANKDQKEFAGTYGLLKIADDLAGGQFRMNGATKKNLYLFAICYQMTFYVGVDDAQIIDYSSDVEKNLFRDYYTNNLMRFLTKEYKENRTSFEKEPNGVGINYKNYAEMVYLYYIAKPYTVVSPEQKIKLATEMIQRIKQKALDENPAPKQVNFDTKSIRNSFCDEIILKNEEEFEQYLLDNYDCNTYVLYGDGKSGGGRVSEMQLAYEQDTAYKYFTKAMADITEMSDLEDLASGLWFVDSSENFQKYLSKYDDIDKAKFEDLINLIAEIDKSTNMQTRADSIKSSKEVTRTALLVAYYHLYMLSEECDDNANSFGEVFDGFSFFVNDKFRDCSYQVLDPKCIFDVLIAFSIYSYQVM